MLVAVQAGIGEEGRAWWVMGSVTVSIKRERVLSRVGRLNRG
jgi:hypothetical protein